MRKLLITAAASIVIFLIGFLPSAAQTGGQKAQLYYIHNYSADPSKTADLETFVKDLAAVFKKYSFPFAVHAYSTMDFQYYFIVPIENYADIDSIRKTLGDISQKMGADNFQKLIARRNAAIQHNSYFVIRYLPELSYTPPKPRHKPEEEFFRHWIFCYPHVEKEGELRATFAKFVDLYKRINYPFTENIFTVELGSDLPLYIGEERGTNIFEFWPSVKEAYTIMGDEGGKLLWKSTLRKIERRDGAYRPELSYIPGK